jgi:hypothetical protein
MAAGIDPPGESSSTEGARVLAMRGSTSALEKSTRVATLIGPEMTILKREPVASLGSMATWAAAAAVHSIVATLKRERERVRKHRYMVRTGLK